MMALDKIQVVAPRVPDLIMEALVKAIQDGVLVVGEELPSERDLAESLGVGRGSLRECLSVLEFLGAIESHGYRKRLIRDASYIREITNWITGISHDDAVSNLIEYRRVIEVGIATLACENATQKDLDAMLSAIRSSEKSPELYHFDLEFHNALATACHNGMLARTIHLINNLIADIRIRFWQKPNYLDRVLKSHYAIYEAVKDRDVQRAQLEMMKHLDIVKEFSEKYPVEEND